LTSQPAYYAPDDIWSIEVGEKARFDDRRFTVNADVFYVKWHNIQQLIVLTCGYPYNTNVGDAKSYGPEIEMAAKSPMRSRSIFPLRIPRPTSVLRKTLRDFRSRPVSVSPAFRSTRATWP